MSTPNYKTSKRYKCPYCDYRGIRSDIIHHVDKKHEELIPEGYTAARAVYDFINKTDHGTCMICKSPVYEWNDKINRYYNLCKNPACKAKVREIALERHMRVYNKPHLLDDPEMQEKMLANRKISGTYTFRDGTKHTYTGTYEKNALEFMDKVLEIPGTDIQSPGPVLEYEYGGKTHKWITDIYYIPANLLIEVKDGGSNPNNRSMTSYREKQVAKETMVTNLGKFNYIRLTNNDFSQLLEILADMKEGALTEDDDHRSMKIRINETAALSVLKEEKSKLDDKFKSKKKINLSSLKRIHITEAVIEKYKKVYPLLKHVRCKDTKEYICDGYMWMDENDKLVCTVGSCQYTDDNTKWIVSLEVVPDYRGHGLSEQVLDYAVKTMKCKYLAVDRDNELAKHVYDKYGFVTYQENDTMYYMHYGPITVNEEVGGLPPHRPPEAYIIPYGMNNVFDGFAYGDSESDDIAIVDEDLKPVIITQEEFENNFTVAPITLIYNESDAMEKIRAIKEEIGSGKCMRRMQFVEMIIGRPLMCYEQIILSAGFKMYDKEREAKINKLLENGVVMKSKEIVTGRNVSEFNVVKRIGAVSIHHSPNGYYASTPNDFSMASEYFPTLDDLEISDVIKLMNDVYSNHIKNTEGDIPTTNPKEVGDIDA